MNRNVVATQRGNRLSSLKAFCPSPGSKNLLDRKTASSTRVNNHCRFAIADCRLKATALQDPEVGVMMHRGRQFQPS